MALLFFEGRQLKALGAMTLLRGLLIVLLVCVGCDTSAPVSEPTPYTLNIPQTFPDMIIPPDNPLTEEGIELGKKLFFDPILSVDSTISCASCHPPANAFSDPLAFSKGVAGETGRNSMPIINIGWMETLFWDGRAISIEDQALQPIQDEIEMGETLEHVVIKLKRHPEYPSLFDAAFQTTSISPELIAKAIAQYERTLISANSKYDQFRAGMATLTPEEELGMNLFFTERGDCFHCHGPRLFTDNRYHNNGLDEFPEDLGLAAITGRPFDAGKFKTPTLRNVEYTAPYMHDGRFQTLEEVIDFYDSGTQPSETIDPLIGRRRQINLTPEEKTALVAFLKTLSEPGFLNNH